MNTKNLIIIIIVVIVIVGLAIFGFLPKDDNSTGMDSGTPSPGTGSGQVVGPNPAGTTRTEAPANVVVPGTNSNAPQNVAKPDIVAAIGGSSVRIFDLKAENSKFIPDTVIVNRGDIVKINLSAVDKDYDFTQPDYTLLNYLAQKGQSRTIEFGASASGKFTFYCSTCGGPDKGPVGYLIVK